MSDITKRILTRVLFERKRQDEKWGQQNHNPCEWIAILGEEFGEASKEALEAHFNYPGESKEDRLLRYRKELIQVAAVAVSMIESVDRNELAAIGKEGASDEPS